MKRAAILVEFDYCDDDLCHQGEGGDVQCFYDSVLKYAHSDLNFHAMRYCENAFMKSHYENKLKVVNSIKINNMKMFD